MLISSIFMIAGFLAALFLVPETLPSVAGNSESNEMRGLHAGEGRRDSPKRSLLLRMQESGARIAELGHWMVRNARVIPLVISFFVFQLGEQAGSTLLLQYASKRLGWSLGKVRNLQEKQAMYELDR